MVHSDAGRQLGRTERSGDRPRTLLGKLREPGKTRQDEQLKNLLADTKSLSTPDQNQQISDFA